MVVKGTRCYADHISNSVAEVRKMFKMMEHYSFPIWGRKRERNRKIFGCYGN